MIGSSVKELPSAQWQKVSKSCVTKSGFTCVFTMFHCRCTTTTMPVKMAGSATFQESTWNASASSSVFSSLSLTPAGAIQEHAYCISSICAITFEWRPVVCANAGLNSRYICGLQSTKDFVHRGTISHFTSLNHGINLTTKIQQKKWY